MTDSEDGTIVYIQADRYEWVVTASNSCVVLSSEDRNPARDAREIRAVYGTPGLCLTAYVWIEGEAYGMQWQGEEARAKLRKLLVELDEQVAEAAATD